MHDISIDLEALDTVPGCALISIGAVAFDRETGQISPDSFYRRITVAGAMAGGSVSPNTLLWWMGQSDEARAVFVAGDNDACPTIAGAVCAFSMWVKQFGDKIRPWGNGATFDVSILEHHMRANHIDAPWKFWNIRDMRTLMDIAAERGFDKSVIHFEGEPHNALDDAKHQARLISAAWQKVRA